MPKNFFQKLLQNPLAYWAQYVIIEPSKGNTQTTNGEGKMTNTIITNEMYTDFIKNTIKTDGWKVADTVNKLALESKKITLDQYRIAAQIIVDAFLAE